MSSCLIPCRRLLLSPSPCHSFTIRLSFVYVLFCFVFFVTPTMTSRKCFQGKFLSLQSRANFRVIEHAQCYYVTLLTSQWRRAHVRSLDPDYNSILTQSGSSERKWVKGWCVFVSDWSNWRGICVVCKAILCTYRLMFWPRNPSTFPPHMTTLP